ncbi:hypothetical protein [Cellulomonas marina]|uniref:Uncharacterized protein n=1 Tax=Cellulomonas marina TaxID=988821 RepID=A0A1I0VMB2_9CELL|nr:hypothetical protein [Cellulomonas marina]GIG27885.1 hypothetical protein Cma02nite_04850 [Cellulomonas marina]SFA77368.1 hypothetical protein SAMN05421867_101480 [Cellulomonas marina]
MSAPGTAPDEGRPDEDRPDDDVLAALEAQFAADAGSPDDGHASGDADAPGDDDAPADEEPLTLASAQPRPTRALVLTQVAAAAPLAAACALAQVDADVVPTPEGALAVLRDPTAGGAGAAAISQLLRTAPVVLFERRASQISAQQWVGGAVQKDVEEPGLLLAYAPSQLEDLLVAEADVSGFDGVVSSVGMSRFKAMAVLARAGRRRPRG